MMYDTTKDKVDSIYLLGFLNELDCENMKIPVGPPPCPQIVVFQISILSTCGEMHHYGFNL